MALGEEITLDEYFGADDDVRALFEVVRAAVGTIGEADVRATKSQVAFRRRVGFAWVWAPNRYLRGETAPLVLTVALGRHDDSPRWKQVVEPAPGRFTHHLEIFSEADVDDEVRRWLREGWEAAE